MDDNKLRKISKKELLEILLSQAKRIEELEDELKKTQSKLDSKKISIEESGSIAEAALKLNNIFEAAEASIDQYILNIKEKCKKIENETKKECKLEREKMLKETEEICQKKKIEADEYLTKIESQVKELTKNTNKISKKKSNSNKKKEPVKNKETIIKDNSKKAKMINKNINETNKEIENRAQIKQKVVVEKSKKPIKGRPVKAIKKES